MGKITITVLLGNDAMQTGNDVAGALRRMAEAFERFGAEIIDHKHNVHTRDVNGNRVASARFVEGEFS